METEKRLLISEKIACVAGTNIQTSKLQIQIPISKSDPRPLKTKLSLFQLIMKQVCFFIPIFQNPGKRTSSRIIKMLSQNDLKARNYIFNSSSTKQDIISPLLSRDLSLVWMPTSKGIPISPTFYRLIKSSTSEAPYHVITIKNKGFELGNSHLIKKGLLEKNDKLIAEKYLEIVGLCNRHNITRNTLDHLMDIFGSDNPFLDALTTPSLITKFGECNNNLLRRSMSLSHDGWILGTSIHISFSKLSSDEGETLCRDITIPIDSLRGDFSAKNILQEMEILDNILVTGT